MFGFGNAEKIRKLEYEVAALKRWQQDLLCQQGTHAPWVIYTDCCGIPTPRCPNCKYHPNEKKEGE